MYHGENEVDVSLGTTSCSVRYFKTNMRDIVDLCIEFTADEGHCRAWTSDSGDCPP